MGIVVLSVQLIPLSNFKTTQFQSSRALRTHQSKTTNLISLSSSWTPCSASAVEQEDSPVSSQDDSLSAQPSSTIDDSVKLSPSGCKACGREEVEKGCNGEGRIQGGIGTVPGFNWWPIKAYRPCPGFLASGGRYQRQGQSMDEVVSGSGKSSKRKI